MTLLLLFISLFLHHIPSFAGDLNQQIVGGVPATKGEFPFIVSIQGDDGHFCGGSLIRKDWVLTAAHCVQDGGVSHIYVGLYNTSSTGEAEHFRPAAIFYDPEFNMDTMDHDYALIRLDGESKLAPVPLNQNDVADGTNTTTAGWGTVKEGDFSLPNILRKVDVPLVSKETCEKSYPKKITDRMLCAGLAKGGKDSCQGDSGGPLLIKKNGQPLLIGIVSWGEGCARAKYYGIYSKVSAGLGWINSKLEAK